MMMEQRGKLRKAQRLHIGITVTTCPTGMEVKLGAIDKEYRKRIVDFGNRLIDWMPQSWVDDMIEILHEDD